MRKTFDAELLELNESLTVMARVAQDAIDVVTESLSSGDESTAKAAIDMTASMDQMERDIENRCLQLLLRQQPVARDLRAISAAMKMVTDLQRIGDQCANIAEISLLLSRQGGTKVPQDIGTMSCKAGLMVRQAIGAYTGRDVETAHAVINLDDEVDELFLQIKRELIEEVAENKDEADSSIDFIIIAKYLESGPSSASPAPCEPPAGRMGLQDRCPGDMLELDAAGPAG